MAPKFSLPLLLLASCDRGQTPREVLADVDNHYLLRHPAGRYMLTSDLKGGVWRMDTTTGALQHCGDAWETADKDGWQNRLPVCSGTHLP